MHCFSSFFQYHHHFHFLLSCSCLYCILCKITAIYFLGFLWPPLSELCKTTAQSSCWSDFLTFLLIANGFSFDLNVSVGNMCAYACAFTCVHLCICICACVHVHICICTLYNLAKNLTNLDSCYFKMKHFCFGPYFTVLSHSKFTSEKKFSHLYFSCKNYLSLFMNQQKVSMM